MKKMMNGLALSTAVSTMVVAGGYKIPEQSLNSMALGAAYVAHTSGADTAYYNPANMAFMKDKQYVEGGVTLATLPPVEYTLQAPYSGQSKRENIVIPNFHYVANAIGDFRWGVSLTAPAGLSKRWDTPFQKAYAEEFTLKVIELSPSFSYKVADNFSVGGGVRIIYSEGIVKSNSSDATLYGFPVDIARDMNGDTFEFGYNLAMTYKPTEDIILAATYRSKVDLDEKGSATLYANGNVVYDGSSDVSIPLPAALNLSISKTWDKTFTLEFNYERTFWSAYKSLDFNYGSSIGALSVFFDDPIDKSWKDTNTYRLGATMLFDRLTLMMGFAIDETPVPDKTIGFELPDSDAKVVTVGFRYQQNENLSWGAAFLYDSKEPRSLCGANADNPVINNGGSFSGGGAYLTTVGMAYEF
ncbi:MAG: outer membrane protein transport protein [Sulfurovum sp.]|nr:outer membrane protein transport protein [Sulfurovum sp.]